MDTKDIEDFIKQSELENYIENFVGVFPVNKLKGIIEDLHSKPYPFCIFNTDTSRENGQHWIALHTLNNVVDKKPGFFIFDSFGKVGLKQFFIQDDAPTLNKCITNLEESMESLKRDRENKFDFFHWNIDCEQYEIMPKKEKNSLSKTTRGLFTLIKSYLKHHNQYFNAKETKIDMYGLADRLQNFDRTTCGLFCLYYTFYLYNPHPVFNMVDAEGDLNTVKKLINSIFVDVSEKDFNDINFELITEFAKANNINVDAYDKELLIK